MHIFEELHKLNKKELLKVKEEINRLLFLNNSMKFK